MRTKAHTWFRLYSEWSDDPKVQMMSEAMQRRLVMLFCLRSKGALETLQHDEIAFHLRISNDELEQTKRLFIEKGFIDEHFHVQNWDKRQFLSDSSTERVRKHRQAKKQDGTFQTPDETLKEHHATENVTAPEQSRADTEKSKKPLPVASPPASAKSVSSVRAGLPAHVAADVTTPDPRFAEFRAAVERYWKHVNGALPMPWDASEAKALNALLHAAPALTTEQALKCLANRAVSETPQTTRPRKWLSSLTDYAAGPLDRYGKPMQRATAPEAGAGQRRGTDADHDTLLQRAEPSSGSTDADTWADAAIALNASLPCPIDGIERATLRTKAAQIIETRARFEQREKAQKQDAYTAAVQVIQELGKASAKELQKRLKLSYAEAIFYLDKMEQEGVISAPDPAHGGARVALMPHVPTNTNHATQEAR